MPPEYNGKKPPPTKEEQQEQHQQEEVLPGYHSLCVHSRVLSDSSEDDDSESRDDVENDRGGMKRNERRDCEREHSNPIARLRSSRIVAPPPPPPPPPPAYFVGPAEVVVNVVVRILPAFQRTLFRRQQKRQGAPRDAVRLVLDVVVVVVVVVVVAVAVVLVVAAATESPPHVTQRNADPRVQVPTANEGLRRRARVVGGDPIAAGHVHFAARAGPANVDWPERRPRQATDHDADAAR